MQAVQAEELEPRRWAHLPVDTHFFSTGFGYTDADISFDPVLEIEDATAEIHSYAAKYIRTFSCFGKTARVGLLQVYQEGRWTGRLQGQPKAIRRSGLADTVLRFAINLYGAPPLKGEDYIAYRRAARSETIVGAGLSVQLPTGEYLEDKLINLGTNRYTFRPQLGVVHKIGDWSVELTGIVALHTDNRKFLDERRLEQDPLYTVHGHLTYQFHPEIWASASLGGAYGGETTIDGNRKDDRKEETGWALSVGFPINRHLGVKITYIGTQTRRSTGTDTDSFLLAATAHW